MWYIKFTSLPWMDPNIIALPARQNFLDIFFYQTGGPPIPLQNLNISGDAPQGWGLWVPMCILESQLPFLDADDGESSNSLTISKTKSQISPEAASGCGARKESYCWPPDWSQLCIKRLEQTGGEGPESRVMSNSPQLAHYPHLLWSIQNEILPTAGFQPGLVLFAIQITLLAAPRNSNKQKDWY